jgi:hypothetical protein
MKPYIEIEDNIKIDLTEIRSKNVNFENRSALGCVTPYSVVAVYGRFVGKVCFRLLPPKTEAA